MPTRVEYEWIVQGEYHQTDQGSTQWHSTHSYPFEVKDLTPGSYSSQQRGEKEKAESMSLLSKARATHHFLSGQNLVTKQGKLRPVILAWLELYAWLKRLL